MINPRTLGAVCACLLAFLVAPTNAVTTFYDTQSGYLGALGGSSSTTYNFDELDAGTLIASGDTLNGATFSYSLSGPDNPSILVDNYFNTTSPSNYLGTNDSSGAFVGGDSFTVTFDHTMRAIGLYVISADLILASDFTITTNNGQSVSNTASVDVSLADGEAYFIGLIEDDYSLGFNSITLSSLDAGYIFNVDNITVSQVPLPGAVWLLISGILGLAGFSRYSISRA
ncbi:MAG: VPLPA-CTERM sorting domain-containing protein [Gammaproteobacteria bacterium]|nr:VPLPA-CTERM sorting domain-containing protein [Gammaproteobacteria bacterium]